MEVFVLNTVIRSMAPRLGLSSGIFRDSLNRVECPHGFVVLDLYVATLFAALTGQEREFIAFMKSASRLICSLILMFSPSAWGFSPIDPRPSADGMPIAAVRLASLPPPVDSSVILNPSLSDHLISFSAKAAISGVRSIGGRWNPPSIFIEAPFMVCFNARIDVSSLVA